MTKHLATRQRQRGFTDDDLKRIRTWGEPMADAYVVTNRAVDAGIAELKSEMQQLETLRNAVLIEVEGYGITAYHAGKAEIKRLRKLEDEGYR